MSESLVSPDKAAAEARALLLPHMSTPEAGAALDVLAHKAALWDALISSPRIRVLGGAMRGAPEEVLGIELYASYPRATPETAEAVRRVTDFAEARLKRAR